MTQENEAPRMLHAVLDGPALHEPLKNTLADPFFRDLKELVCEFAGEPDRDFAQELLSVTEPRGIRCRFEIRADVRADLPGEYAVLVRHAEDWRRVLSLPGAPEVGLVYSDAAAEELLRIRGELLDSGRPFFFRCSEDFFAADNPVLDRFLEQTEAGCVPFPGGTPCRMALDGCFIDADGEVYVCAVRQQSMGNILTKDLSEILIESHERKYMREYRKKFKEPCRACPDFGFCTGCRGRVFRFSGDMTASDPFCRRNRERRHEIVTLPFGDTGRYLPHKKPVLMIDRMLSIENNACNTECVVREDNPFYGADGRLDPSAMIELAAQSLALLDTFLNPGEFQKGLLVEVLRFECSARPLTLGSCLHVHTGRKYDMDPWHICAFEVRLDSGNGEFIARGELKVCQSDDLPF